MVSKKFLFALAASLLLMVSVNGYSHEDSLRYQAGPQFAASNPDSLVVDDILWINRYVLPDQTWGKITNIERLRVSPALTSVIKSKYRFFITQPIDHNPPELGTFKQRVIVAFNNFKGPNVLITEGYGAASGSNPRYGEEIAVLLGGNIIQVEHRYFNESVPFMQDDSTITWETLNWDYMTSEQEAADLHITFFKG